MASKEILTLRAMAWARAKGELQAYLQTFWPEYSTDGKEIKNGFEEADSLIEKFIDDIENSVP